MTEKICPKHGEPDVWWGDKRRCCFVEDNRNFWIKIYLTRLHPSEWKRLGERWVHPFVKSFFSSISIRNPRRRTVDIYYDLEHDEKAEQVGYAPLSNSVVREVFVPKELSMDHCLPSPSRRSRPEKYVVVPKMGGLPDYMCGRDD